MTAEEADTIQKEGFDAMMDEAYRADLARHQEEQAQAEQDRRAAEYQAFKEEAKAQLTATGRMDAAQAEANAELYARAFETLSSRLDMGIREFDSLYGGLNVVGESLIDAGALNQALASNPPRGWVHTENGQEVYDLWNGTGNAQTVYWTDIDSPVSNLIPETSDYSHSISADIVKHIQNRHGADKNGQLPVTENDIAKIPEIVSSPDVIEHGKANPGNGAKRIIYAKRTEDGLLVYVEEARKNRKDLKAVSMWKYPPTADVQNVIKHISSPSLYVRNGEAAYGNSTPTPTPIKTSCSNPQRKSNANSTKPPRNTAARRHTTKPKQTAKPNLPTANGYRFARPRLKHGSAIGRMTRAVRLKSSTPKQASRLSCITAHGRSLTGSRGKSAARK